MKYGDKDPYITPGEVRSEVRHWTPTVVLLVVLAMIAFGVFITFAVQLGFWLDTANQQHQVKVRQIQASAYNGNIGVQNAYVQQALTDIKGATAAGVSKANATYDAGDACYQFSNIQISAPSTLTTFAEANCDGSQLKQTSQFYQP